MRPCGFRSGVPYRYTDLFANRLEGFQKLLGRIVDAIIGDFVCGFRQSGPVKKGLVLFPTHKSMKKYYSECPLVSRQFKRLSTRNMVDLQSHIDFRLGLGGRCRSPAMIAVTRSVEALRVLIIMASVHHNS